MKEPASRLTLRKVAGWVQSLPAGLRIPTFVIPFLLLWWGLGTLQLPELGMVAILFMLVVGGLGLWGRSIHRHLRPYRALGLHHSAPFYREMMVGAVFGWAGGFLPFFIEGWLGWLEWVPVEPIKLLSALVNAMATAIAVGFAEELLFRGWLLEELRLNYGIWLAGGIATVIYAAVHQWGPQFFGLLLVGSILVRAKVLTGDRLGLSMGLHSGWVFAISFVNIASAFKTTGAVPDWITGIDGNPLAGMVGGVTLSLTLLAIELYFRPK